MVYPGSQSVQVVEAGASKGDRGQRAYGNLSRHYRCGMLYRRKIETEEFSGHVASQDSQCYGASSSSSADGLLAVFCLLCPQFLHRGIYFQPLPVRGRCRRTVKAADGSRMSGCNDLRQTLFQERGTGQLRVASGSRQLSLQWGRLRCPLQGKNGRLSGKMRYGHAAPGRVNAVQGSETMAGFSTDGLKVSIQ